MNSILPQEQELDCGLISLGKHDQCVLEKLLLNSINKHILAESSCDVLAANYPLTGLTGD